MLKDYGADNSRPNGNSFTLPGGANAVQIRSGATSGNDIGIFHLSDDNAFICNSSDNNYTFAVFDTDKTADFSNAANSSFAVLSDKGGCTVNGNTIIHAGNISSQSVNYATSAGSANSVAWGNVTGKPSTFTPSSHTHAYIKGPDNRSTNNAPSWYMSNIGSASIYTEFAQSGGAVSNVYENRVTFTPWGDNSGQRPVQMAFNNSGAFIRTSASDSSWNTWATFITSNNIGSQSVNYASSAGSVSWSNVTSKVTSKGSATQPVYINSNGDPVACTAYGSASVNYANSAGSATDSTKLPLAGGAMSSGARISFSSGNGYIGNSGNQGWVGFQDISSQDSLGDSKWSLRTNGTAHFVNAYASSDRRKKKNIKQISESEYLEYFKTTDGFFKCFTWKETGNKSFGAIAQEVEGWCPECVDHNDDGYLSINYNALLSKACAALFLKVKELEKELEELKRS